MNKVLRLLVLSDLFILSGFGLIQPIFAIFVIRQIPGATITAIGIAATVQLFTRAVFQIIIGKWADDERGNKRELYALVAGSIIISVVPLGFIFASSLSILYLVQFVHGLGQALWYPSWRVIFTRYADNRRAGYEWGLYDTVTSFGVATAAALGGYFTEQFSFTPLFIAVSAASFIGSLFLVHIFQQETTHRAHTHKK